MKKNIYNKDKDYSFDNSDNYNESFDYNIEEVIEKYIFLSNEFLKFILEKTTFKNKNYTKFIIIRGYETITNVFNIILYYTKNVELTFYHCQKAYYYYIEFIEQIYDEQNLFLQLNSRDAITYVYKKTIFELKHDVKKYMQPCIDDTKNKLEIIDEFIKIFKSIFECLIETIQLNDLLINVEIINKFKIVCQKLFLKHNKANKANNENNVNKIKNIYNTIENINNIFLTNNLDKNITETSTYIDEYLAFILQQT
jgi:hypothetical protein